MLKIHFILIIFFTFFTGNIFAQEVLPRITIYNNKGKISISWLNTYLREVKAISVQRSYDSIKNFSSIATVTYPDNTVNGFKDEHAPYNKMYYRLFITFDSGAYTFSESKKPVLDSNFDFSEILKKIAAENKNRPAASKKINNIISTLSPAERNSMLKALQNTKAPNQPVPQTRNEEIEVKKIPLIYTGNEGNIIINIPDFEPDKYVVKFYEEGNKFLFELNKLKEGYLIIEKVNFFHAGWFYFEVYTDDKLVEKDKFYIPKADKN